MKDAKAQIQELIDGHRIVLFMKGNKSFPACGFSQQVVRILKEHGAVFETFNVLADAEVRAAAKEFAGWPTFPQLYVDGEFVGGCDIVSQLHASGELAPLLAPR